MAMIVEVLLAVAGLSQPLPKVSLANVPVLAEPEAGAGAEAVFTLRLSRPAAKPASVRYRTLPGTATAGQDYVPVSGTLAFKRGERAKKVSVRVLPDEEAEDRETLYLSVSRPRGAKLGTSREAQATIEFNDLPASFTVHGSLRALNGRGSGSFQIRLDPAAGTASFTIESAGIPATQAPFATHIHAGFPSFRGPESLNFFPLPPPEGRVTGTVEANRLMILELRKDASRYIVHVHTPEPEYGLVGTLQND